ncbi:class I SAM-dependent methyltransferase [Bacillus sp. Bva_UNVM-123]|uniref:methyltransferase domain-containing protein n=1 Tax=Bacillus sp. Bva_UNVM-123 TaxID=2829798 RepID=UPI00391F709D
MEDYYWDNKLEYLKNTRDLYYNDDYLAFLVNFVWKLTKPVNLIDFGCGYGYLGLKLLPLLPKGSTYTGIDKGGKLIKEARELFRDLPYETEFMIADMTELELESKYDVAVCHAFLLHMADPKSMLEKMVDSVVHEGKIICFEPNWISNMSSYYINEQEQSHIIQLGILQKLFENDAKQNRIDGNIGIKIPIYLTELNVKNIECRVSDKVNFLHPNMNQKDKQHLYHSFKEEGIGNEPIKKKEFIERLIARGLTEVEAIKQFEAELHFSEIFNINTSLMYAPSMKITYGEIYKEG